MKKKILIEISIFGENGYKKSDEKRNAIWLCKIFGYHFAIFKDLYFYTITELSSGGNIGAPMMKSKCLDFIKKDTKERGKKTYKQAIDRLISQSGKLNQELIKDLNKFM